MFELGDLLPDVVLFECCEQLDGCALGPTGFSLRDRCAGRRVVMFGVPGAFTPTCSERHFPDYLDAAQELFSCGVDEILCVAVNDAFVMRAWGQVMQPKDVIKMISDGSAELTLGLGLALDLTTRGMGIRSQRYALLVEDCVVRKIYVDEPGKFDSTSARNMLAWLSMRKS